MGWDNLWERWYQIIRFTNNNNNNSVFIYYFIRREDLKYHPMVVCGTG